MRVPYYNARQMTADMISDMASRGVDIIASVAGNVTLIYKGGARVAYPVATGLTRINDVAMVGFSASGTTATASVFMLD